MSTTCSGSNKNKLLNNATIITPLFLSIEASSDMGKNIITLNTGGYNKNKNTDVLFLDAENDAEAISSFLLEYRDSPATLQAYAKEIERLLLWCIYIGKTNISNLKRDHLLVYQDFIKNPQPKKIWCGPKVSRLHKDGTINPDWRPFYHKGLSATRCQVEE